MIDQISKSRKESDRCLEEVKRKVLRTGSPTPDEEGAGQPQAGRGEGRSIARSLKKTPLHPVRGTNRPPPRREEVILESESLQTCVGS